MLLNVVKLQTKGLAVSIYLAVVCTLNVVLERMLEVLLAADSPLRLPRLSSTECYRNWLYRMVCAFDFSESRGRLKSCCFLQCVP